MRQNIISKTRIYIPYQAEYGISFLLLKETASYLTNVLRLSVGASLTVFNGEGGEYDATLTQITPKAVEVTLGTHHAIERESPCYIHVFHGLAKGDKMDWIIQKAVEMGVREFTPLKTDKCVVKLHEERAEKRYQHWQRIIESSSAQCGRNTLMILHPVTSFKTALFGLDATSARAFGPLVWHDKPDATLPHPSVTPAHLSVTPAHLSVTPAQAGVQSNTSMTLLCDPHIPSEPLPLESPTNIRLFIGGESGFSDTERALAAHHAQGYSLGPRILRTETAAIVAVALLQQRYGDL